MATKNTTGFGASGFGDSGFGGGSVKTKTDPLASVLKANTKSRADLASMGVADPTATQQPSFLEHLFGVIDTPATGIRAIVHNLIDKKAPVDVLGEMGKSLAGKKRVEGSDIVGDLGVTNKWGKMLGGFAADVLLDPITYATFGYDAITKAAAKAALVQGAEYGFDAAKMVEAANAMDDAGKAANLMKAAEAIGNANIPTEIASQLADGAKIANGLSRADEYKLYHSVLAGTADSLGRAGGMKFMGIPLGGQGAMDTASAVAREAGSNIPVLSSMFNKFSGAGPIEELVLKGGQKSQEIARAVAHATVEDAQATLSQFPDEMLQHAASAVEQSLTPDEWKAYGEAKDAIAAAQVEAAKLEGQINNAASRAAQAKIPMWTKELDRANATVAEHTGAIGEMLAQAVPQSADRVKQALVAAGADEALAQKFVDEALPKVQGIYDSLASLRKAAGVGQNALIPEAMAQGAPRSFAFTPHVPERATPAPSGALDTIKELLTGRPASEAAAADISPALQNVADQAGVAADSLTGLPKQPFGSGTSSVGNVAMREQGATLPEFAANTGLKPNLDFNSLVAGKVHGDLGAVAKAEAADSFVQSVGRPMTGAFDEATGQFVPGALSDPVNNEVMHIVRNGADQFYEVPRRSKALFDALDKSFTDDAGTKGFLSLFDKAQGLWKKTATRYNIAQYNSRNAMWNAWLMAANGGLDPETYVLGKSLMFGGDAALAAEHTIGGITHTGQEWMDMALQYGGREGQFLKSETGRASEDIIRSLAGKADQAAAGLANKVEDADRMAVFLTGIKKGLSPEAAGQFARDTLYDFAPETKTMFERQVMSRLIPFYGWMRNNTPHMIELLGKNPASMTWLSHLKESGRATNPIDESVMPDYMSKLFPIVTPLKDASGNNIVWNSNSPMLDLNNLMMKPNEALSQITPLLRTPMELILNKNFYYNAPISNYTGDSRRAPGYIEAFDDLVHSTPMLKEPAAEWDKFKKAFGIIEKKGADGSPYLAMNAYALKAASDLNPWFNNVGKMLDNAGKTPYDRTALITGLKTIPYDTASFASQKAYADRTALQDALTGLRSQGRTPAKKKSASKSDPLTQLLGGGFGANR